MEILRAKGEYPSLSGIQKNLNDANIISSSYAGRCGELNAVLTYSYQAVIFESNGLKEVAELLRAISVCEMEHTGLLANVIYRLGKLPVYATYYNFYNDFYSSNAVNYDYNLKEIILDDVSSELLAINDYTVKAEKVCEKQVSEILKRIVLDEKVHVEELKKCIDKINVN